MPSQCSLGSTLNLEWASLQMQPPGQLGAKALFNHLGAPTWVTSWCYPARQTDMLVRDL